MTEIQQAYIIGGAAGLTLAWVSNVIAGAFTRRFCRRNGINVD